MKVSHCNVGEGSATARVVERLERGGTVPRSARAVGRCPCTSRSAHLTAAFGDEQLGHPKLFLLAPDTSGAEPGLPIVSGPYLRCRACARSTRTPRTEAITNRCTLPLLAGELCVGSHYVVPPSRGRWIWSCTRNCLPPGSGVHGDRTPPGALPAGWGIRQLCPLPYPLSLHRYGIDVLHRLEHTTFQRLEAPRGDTGQRLPEHLVAPRSPVAECHWAMSVHRYAAGRASFSGRSVVSSQTRCQELPRARALLTATA